jgi:uncharacterized protein YjiS (DUF1127 family)
LPGWHNALVCTLSSEGSTMFNSMGAAFGVAPFAPGRGLWRQLAAAIRLSIRTQVTRQALPELSDHMLADIGVTRDVALAEASRSLWDVEPVLIRRF